LHHDYHHLMTLMMMMVDELINRAEARRFSAATIMPKASHSDLNEMVPGKKRSRPNKVRTGSSNKTQLLYMLISMVVVEVVVFYHFSPASSTTATSLSSSVYAVLVESSRRAADAQKEPERPLTPGRDVRRRIVNVYDAANPLLSVERRSEARPYLPPFPPLMFQPEDGGSGAGGSPSSSSSSSSTSGATTTWAVERGIGDGVGVAADGEDGSVNRTLRVLASMGALVGGDHDDDVAAAAAADFDDWSRIPPWSQIIDNYYSSRRVRSRKNRDDTATAGGNSSGFDHNNNNNSNRNNNNEVDRGPVLLGLERCRAYRESVPPEMRSIGPAGMFSTGTNLLVHMLRENCIPPHPHHDAAGGGGERSGPRPRPRRFINGTTTTTTSRFHAWQVPWGKRTLSSSFVLGWMGDGTRFYCFLFVHRGVQNFARIAEGPHVSVSLIRQCH
jgi:hypothetical protein